MTEQEWLACTDPEPMLAFLRKEASERKLRLLACACCRRVWDRVRLDAARQIVELSEGYTDGEVGEPDLRAAYHPDFADLEAAVAEQRDDGTRFSARVLLAIEAAWVLASPEFFEYSLRGLPLRTRGLPGGRAC
jgi:hypothetical protein